MRLRNLLGIESRNIDRESIWHDAGLDIFDRAATTRAGTVVGPIEAMQVSTVYACVRIISSNIATLPADSYVESDTVKKPLRPRPEWLNFEVGPTDKMTTIATTVVSMLLYGNAYWATYRDKTGTIQWVEVLDPRRVQVDYPASGGPRATFRVNGGELGPMDLLHFPGLVLPGTVVGVSPITMARESIGLSLAATEYGASFFGNGSLPGLGVEVPGLLAPAGIDLLRAQWNQGHQGVGNAHKLAVLTEGAKFSKLTLTPDEAQFLQTRAFQISDIARIFGVPPHLLADATGSTSWGSGLSEQNTMFLQQTLLPWVARIESKLSWLLRSEGASDKASVRLNVDALTRGNLTERVAAYDTYLTQDVVTINEVRAWEDLPPVKWGDKPASERKKDNAPPPAPPAATPESLTGDAPNADPSNPTSAPQPGGMNQGQS